MAKKLKFQRKNEQMNFENFTIKAQESVQKAAITYLCKGSKVSSQSSEETYDSLNRYTIDLNDQARAGRLVITNV